MLQTLIIKCASNPDLLAKWIHSRLEARAKVGLDTWFPGINLTHMECSENLTDSDDDNFHKEDIRSKILNLNEKLMVTEKKINELLAANNKLHASSKSWYLKFQEQASSRDKDLDDQEFYETPKKQNKCNSPDYLLNLL